MDFWFLTEHYLKESQKTDSRSNSATPTWLWKFQHTAVYLYRSGLSSSYAAQFYSALDEKRLTALISLDISVAFTTISHSILLRRHETEFGVVGIALDKLQSYLSDRRHHVKFGRHCSETVLCSSGVPHGSVLGPLLFAVYISPVGDLIKSKGVDYHQYADDVQLFLSLETSSLTADLQKLESCSMARKAWFTENELLPNVDKSDAMLIGTSAELRAANNISRITVAGANLKPTSKLKSLGVILSNQLTFIDHVSAISKACNYYLLALRYIRNLLAFFELLIFGLSTCPRYQMLVSCKRCNYNHKMMKIRLWYATKNIFA